MALNPVAACRFVYRATFGRLFPGLPRKICGVVFESEYQQLRIDNKRVTERAELLERSLVRLYAGSNEPAGADPVGSNAPLISVVLPTYNRAHCIQEAIRSIISQQFRQWELIIVDDGSTDMTGDVVAPFLRDRRIVYVTQEHRGHSAARNRALAMARGSIVTYLDSDNVALPDFLYAVAVAFAEDPATDFAYGALLTRHHGGAGSELLWEPFNRDQLLLHNFIDLNSVAHRRFLFDRYGGFDESLDRLTDWDLALRYTAHAAARPIKVIAAQYRLRDNSRITDMYPFEPAYRKIRGKWTLA